MPRGQFEILTPIAARRLVRSITLNVMFRTLVPWGGAYPQYMAAPTVDHPWHRYVPRIGTPAQFATLRRLFRDADYSDDGIRKRLGLETLEHYRAPEELVRPFETPLDALIRLFFDCGFVEDTAVVSALPAGIPSLLEALGLLVHDETRPGMVYATVAVLPAFGLLTVCDRGEHTPDGKRTELPPDVVYPAILDTTRRFIASLPSSPCDAMLDIGTGTGIAAMLGAAKAREVWATDITTRAAIFAEFNARLAGLDNMSVAAGDMYAPVEGRTFDRITIHPPYVPAKVSKFVYRDAGEDGEQIIRRAIEGLPQHLRVGGRFYSMQLATDREGETFEQRIRKWLGPAEGEFDIVLGAHTLRSPMEFLAESLVKAVDRENRDFVELWRATKTELLVYGAVLIERYDGTRPPITKRIQAGPGFDGRHQEWLLDWCKTMTAPGHVEMLLESRPSVAADCELHVVSRLHEDRFRMEQFNLKSNQPFRSSFKCDGPVAQILTGFHGQQTAREHFQKGQEAGLIPATLPESEFAEFTGMLVSIGILRLPEHLPPPPTRASDE